MSKGRRLQVEDLELLASGIDINPWLLDIIWGEGAEQNTGVHRYATLLLWKAYVSTCFH